MSHTPEPWRFQKYKSTSIIVDCAQPDHIIGDVHSDENARRIVACVNACEGIPTDDLELCPHKGLFHLVEFSNKAVLDRDTYRDLCVELVQTLRHLEGAANDIQCSRLSISLGARNAITKAEQLLGEKNAT